MMVNAIRISHFVFLSNNRNTVQMYIKNSLSSQVCNNNTLTKVRTVILRYTAYTL
jgi:hypothetical protein